MELKLMAGVENIGLISRLSESGTTDPEEQHLSTIHSGIL
jgi:hypothetical protein